MRTIRPARLSPSSTADRGAVLAMAALLMTAFVMFAAIAVDLSWAYLMGQRLQRASDAAALAGAQEWQLTTGTPTQKTTAARTRAQNALTQSGFPSARFAMTFSATSAGVTSVEVQDTRPARFLSGIFRRSGPRVARAATADMSACATCATRTLELTPLSNGISAPGEGDGFSPTIVGGDRLYALNHHAGWWDRTIQCVSRATQSKCAGYGSNQPPYTFTSHISPMVYVPAEGELWFSAQSTTHWGMACWQVDPDDPTLDGPCPDAGALQDQGYGRLWIRDAEVKEHTHSFKTVRGAAPTLLGSRLYAMGDNLRMYCVNPRTKQTCGALDTASRSLSPLPVLWDDEGRQGTKAMDTEVWGTRLLTLLPLRNLVGGANVVIDCFDTATRRACTDFGSGGAATLTLREDGGREDHHLMLFAHYDRRKNVDGFCAWGYSDLSCVRLDGSAFTSPLEAELVEDLNCQPMKEAVVMVGALERTFFPINYCFGISRSHRDRSNGAGLCWNWDTQTSCGFRTWADQPFLQSDVTMGTTDYAYTLDGNDVFGYCLIGLGHNSYWWSFRAEDMSACDRAMDVEELLPCRCTDNGTVTRRWGRLTLDSADIAKFADLQLVIFADADLTTEVKRFDLKSSDDRDGIIDLDDELAGLADTRAKLWLALGGRFNAGVVPVTITAEVTTRARPVLLD